MPTFKTTKNIFIPWEDELYNDNWMDRDTIYLPPKRDWDYARELQIEDINIWEVIGDYGGGAGVYAAWDPYAEFYMLRHNWRMTKAGYSIETFYGPGAQKNLQKRMKEMDFPFHTNQIWVEPEDMWIYQDPEPKANTLILP
jgi:hypothetical protein